MLLCPSALELLCAGGRRRSLHMRVWYSQHRTDGPSSAGSPILHPTRNLLRRIAVPIARSVKRFLGDMAALLAAPDKCISRRLPGDGNAAFCNVLRHPESRIDTALSLGALQEYGGLRPRLNVEVRGDVAGDAHIPCGDRRDIRGTCLRGTSLWLHAQLGRGRDDAAATEGCRRIGATRGSPGPRR